MLTARRVDGRMNSECFRVFLTRTQAKHHRNRSQGNESQQLCFDVIFFHGAHFIAYSLLGFSAFSVKEMLLISSAKRSLPLQEGAAEMGEEEETLLRQRV
jgi:hypothetical protein